MMIYACTNFRGHYPVGTAAVVVARSPKAAEAALRGALASDGLPQDADWKPEWKVLPSSLPGVYILRNGEY